MQSGSSPSGSPGWVAAARPFLLGSILFGYFFSAALFLTSARLMKRDKLKLETVMQSGSLDAVSGHFPACGSLSLPTMLCISACMRVLLALGVSSKEEGSAILREGTVEFPSTARGVNDVQQVVEALSQ